MRQALTVFGGVIIAVVLLALIIASYRHPAPTSAGVIEEPQPVLPHQKWSFDGPFGTYDRAAVQRGFQVYSEICSQCHSMTLMHYGDLGPGGPGGGIGYTEDEVKAIAATPFVNAKQVTDGPNDQGLMFQRPGRPSDKFVAPFDHPEEAAAAYGAIPPDLSVIVKARAGGADYVYGLLTSYKDEPPPGVKMAAPNLQYNEYFPGHQIAMPPPLEDNRVTYADGTKATLDQEARDIATFLSWASEPIMEERKRDGAKVLIFLAVMVIVFFFAKRKVWADVH
jgi:ubiquinol-cytochrome c reductase cytochrome c1 subunit